MFFDFMKKSKKFVENEQKSQLLPIFGNKHLYKSLFIGYSEMMFSEMIKLFFGKQQNIFLLKTLKLFIGKNLFENLKKIENLFFEIYKTFFLEK